MINYQKDVKKTSVAKCGRGDFWREVKSQKTEWHINAPPRTGFLHLLPELFPCAGKSLRKMCILLICYHLIKYVLMFFCLKNNLFICLREAEDQ